MAQIWLIVGASRGIGLEFVTQLLEQGNTVIATARSPPPPKGEVGTGKLWPLVNTPNGKNLRILECDVSDEVSVQAFSERLGGLFTKGGGALEGGSIDCVVLNAGILDYPNRVSEISFASFARHLHTNTIGPLITAQSILALPLSIKTLVFISSDSGSTTIFNSHEDGFGVYGASKAALNQSLRHLSAELHRKYPASKEASSKKAPVVLALHPGEVSTDMANINVDWVVPGVITPQESIRCMLKVIEEKGCGGKDEGGRVSAAAEGKPLENGAATFWTWQGNSYPW